MKKKQKFFSWTIKILGILKIFKECLGAKISWKKIFRGKITYRPPKKALSFNIITFFRRSKSKQSIETFGAENQFEKSFKKGKLNKF